MSFEITPIAGTVQELNIDLSKPSQHEREELVIEEVKKAIDHIVTALGGYLSVSCNGNINPISGESGDLVNIYITSLPAPPVAATPKPVETQEGLSELGKIEDVSPETELTQVQKEESAVLTEEAVTETSPSPLPVAPPENTEAAQQETALAEQPQELTQPPVIESTPSPTAPIPDSPPVYHTPFQNPQPVENPSVVSEQPES